MGARIYATSGGQVRHFGCVQLPSPALPLVVVATRLLPTQQDLGASSKRSPRHALSVYVNERPCPEHVFETLGRPGCYGGLAISMAVAVVPMV